MVICGVTQPVATREPAQAAPPIPLAPFGLTVLIICLGALLTSGQLYITIPLTEAISTDLSIAGTTVTSGATAFGLAYAAGFVLFGPLSDALGRRRVIVVSMVAIALTTLAVALATSPVSLITLRAIQGLFAGAYGPAAMAYLGERIAANRRTIAMASLITSFFASSVVVQLVAAEMVQQLGWEWVFVGGGAVGAALTAALFAILLPDRARARSRLTTSYRHMFTLVTDPPLRSWFIASAGVLSGYVAVYTALPAVTSDAHVTWLRVVALPAFVAAPLLAHRLGHVTPSKRGTIMLSIGAALLAFVAATGGAFVPMLILLPPLVIALALASSSLAQASGDRAAHARAGATAIYSAMIFVGGSIGSAVAAGLADKSFTTIIGVTTIVVVIGAAAAVLGSAQAQRNGPMQTPN